MELICLVSDGGVEGEKKEEELALIPSFFILNLRKGGGVKGGKNDRSISLLARRRKTQREGGTRRGGIFRSAH